MQVDKSAVIKQEKKAYESADFAHLLTYRILMNAAKRLIEDGYRQIDVYGIDGYDFAFRRTNQIVVQSTYIREEMERMIKDLMNETTASSKRIAELNIGKLPSREWDKDAFVASVIYGKTYDQRVWEYIAKFRNEIEAYVKVGSASNMTAQETIQWYVKNVKNPAEAPEIIDAINDGLVQMKGKGSLNSFGYLNDDMVTRAFHDANTHYWTYASSKYIIVTMDEHTCDSCKALDGKVFPIHEMILPVHGKCRCLEIPIL